MLVSGVVFSESLEQHNAGGLLLLEIWSKQFLKFNLGPTTEISSDLTQSIEAYRDNWDNLKINLSHDASLPG